MSNELLVKGMVIQIGIYQAQGTDRPNKWGLELTVPGTGTPALRFGKPEYDTEQEAAYAAWRLTAKGVMVGLRKDLSEMAAESRREMERSGRPIRPGDPIYITNGQDEPNKVWEDRFEERVTRPQSDDAAHKIITEARDEAEHRLQEQPSSQLLSLGEIQKQIQVWSLREFGRNSTDLLTSTSYFNHTMPNVKITKTDVHLDSLCALLGLCEEVGEFEEAKSVEDQVDGLCDVSIYLCDYASREGIELGIFRIDRLDDRRAMEGFYEAYLEWTRKPLPALVGKLHQAHLKRFQGIRGFDNPEKFKAQQLNAVFGIVGHIWKWFDEVHHEEDEESEHYWGENYHEALNRTWTKIVQKREWLKDALYGGGHAHRSQEVS